MQHQIVCLLALNVFSAFARSVSVEVNYDNFDNLSEHSIIRRSPDQDVTGVIAADENHNYRVQGVVDVNANENFGDQSSIKNRRKRVPATQDVSGVIKSKHNKNFGTGSQSGITNQGSVPALHQGVSGVIDTHTNDNSGDQTGIKNRGKRGASQVVSGVIKSTRNKNSRTGSQSGITNQGSVPALHQGVHGVVDTHTNVNSGDQSGIKNRGKRAVSQEVSNVVKSTHNKNFGTGSQSGISNQGSVPALHQGVSGVIDTHTNDNSGDQAGIKNRRGKRAALLPLCPSSQNVSGVIKSKHNVNHRTGSQSGISNHNGVPCRQEVSGVVDTDGNENAGDQTGIKNGK